MEQLQQGSDVFFLLMGAILVFAMHGGFAFLEVGTVRHFSQVNALVKIIVDFAISTIVYFFFGYWLSYGVTFLADASALTGGAEGFAPYRLEKALRVAEAVMARRDVALTDADRTLLQHIAEETPAPA